MLITASLKVAVVASRRDDQDLVAALLSQVRTPQFQIETAQTPDEARLLIQAGRHEVCLLHESFASGDTSMLRDAVATGQPVLLLLDRDDVEAEDAALDAGAWGTAVTTELTPSALRNSIRRAVEHARQVKALTDTEHELRHALSLLSATLENTVDGMLVVDLQGRVVACNRQFLDQWHVPEAVATQRESHALLGWIREQVQDGEALEERVRRLSEDCTAETCDLVHLKNGRILEETTVPQRTAGQVVGRVVSAHDVTERVQLESQLRHAQKMEAVGRLAGGVAHDFNNLLTAIIGYAEMLREETPASDPRAADIAEIQSAAERATALTRQLLTFSRRQSVLLRPLDLNEVVSGFQRMVSRVIGEDIALEVRLAPDLAPVKADSGQMEQVLMNLAVNARDAMPGGGRLVVETANVVLDAAYARTHTAVKPGPYARIEVRDTGTGMSPAVLSHVFEPFFTTKEKGKGTGLGLATVYGIVQQSNGHISVASEAGRGTTFTIHLPAVCA